MTLVGLLIIVIVCGLLVYLVGLLPIAEPFKRIAIIIVVVIVILYLLSALTGYIPNPEIRIR